MQDEFSVSSEKLTIKSQYGIQVWAGRETMMSIKENIIILHNEGAFAYRISILIIFTILQCRIATSVPKDGFVDSS